MKPIVDRNRGACRRRAWYTNRTERAVTAAYAGTETAWQPPTAPGPPPIRRRRAGRRVVAQPVRADVEARVSGRWSSIEGDPARYQRYEDIRAASARHRRALRARERRLAVPGGRRQRRLARPAILRHLRAAGRFVVSGLWDQIPQFYSVDTQTPYSPAPGDSPLTLDDGVQRSIQNGQVPSPPLNAYVAPRNPVRSPGASGHRPRHRDRHADEGDRRQGGVHDDQAHRRAALGRQLWLQQRRGSGAALRLPHQRPQLSARSGRTAAAWFAWPTTGRGSTTSTTRSCGTARSVSMTPPVRPAVGAWRSGRRTRRRRSARRLPRSWRDGRN